MTDTISKISHIKSLASNIVQDKQSIDLKDKNWSAYHDMSKLVNSDYVYKIVLEDSHRHDSIDELLELLNGSH